MTEQGTFEDGLSTLQLLGDPEPERLADVRARLSAVREQRARPSRDDKVVAAWNSWLICSLIDAAMVFNEPTWLECPNRRRVAVAGALGRCPVAPDLPRRPGGVCPGILEDYAALPKPVCGWRPRPPSRCGWNAPGNSTL